MHTITSIMIVLLLVVIFIIYGRSRMLLKSLYTFVYQPSFPFSISFTVWPNAPGTQPLSTSATPPAEL